jgi:tetratricopeptide (TPR) repeat protein
MKWMGVTAAAILLAAALGVRAAMPQDSSPASNLAQAARVNNLGAAYMDQQLFDKALQSFEQAALLDPSLEIAKLNQGIALLNLGRIDAARKLLEQATVSAPGDAHAWYNLGLLDKSGSHPEAAVEAFERVIHIDANDPETWYFLGTVYAQLKQYPQAIAAFEHALQLNPLHASAQFGLSRAYQQSGDTAQARTHLTRFQYVTQNKLGSPISLAYGDQGKYSRVEDSPAAVKKVPDAIPVRFRATTESAGLSTSAWTGGTGDPALALGPGACFLDYDGDGRLDIFLPASTPFGKVALYHNLGNGRFEDVTRAAKIDPELQGVGCTAGDYDNDGATDLALTALHRIVLLHNEKNGTFKDVTAPSGLISEGNNVAVTFVDYDHDGDLDLYVTRLTNRAEDDTAGKNPETYDPAKASNVMWRNNGNGTFTDVTDAVGLAGKSVGVAAVGTDYNNDRAVDLALTNWHNPATVYENPREGKFLPRQLWSAPLPPLTMGVSVLDFDHDGWMDLAFTHWAAPGVSLWRNQKGTSFDPVALPATGWVHAWGVAAFDYDNDGWVDLVAVGETGDGRGQVKLFRNLGPAGFEDVSTEVGLDKIVLKDPRAVITGDYDNDGATDLLITQNHGPAVLLQNQGGNRNHSLRLSLTGLNDNKSAIGTKVEVFAAGNRQKFEIAGSSGYLGQNSTQLTIGLAEARDADVVRMLWPTGVLQDEIEVAGGRDQRYTEMDRRGSSCPTLFAWNGSDYQLVADVLGAGVLGHWVAPGERNRPRPTEYIKLDRGLLSENHGKLSFKLIEPMEEVVYLDQVQLLAVDHPGGVEVFPNERFASNPPYPSFQVVASRNPRPPAGATDEHGRDVLPDLVAHRYFGNFDLLPFKGFTKLHRLEIDLGEPYDGGALRLLLHGEIEYFTATGMYAAAQSGIQAIPPYLEVLDAQGNWTRVIDDLGFPAGLPRTMVAELSGKLPYQTKRIRISTNLQIYWDNILIDRTEQNLNPHLSFVPLERAELGFHGYPRQIEAKPPGNVNYVYRDASPTGPYARQAGAYTRYGDVTPLLLDVDDMPVVFGSGEEVSLQFNPESLKAPPAGWTRDYFFVANGYEKDMDFYAAEGGTVEPLPFRRMGSYPYSGKTFPLDAAHLDYLLRYNTRYVSGDEPRGYGYDYPGSQ